MTLTILQIVNEVLTQIGSTPVKTLCKSENALEKQLLALINSQGRMLSRCTRWQGLIKTHVFKTIRGKTQPEGLPEDFLEMVKDDRFPKLYQIQYNMFKSREDMIENQQIAYDYITKNWVISADQKTDKENVTQDSDLIKFDDQLFILGLKSYFLEEKGLDYISSKMAFSKLLDHLIGMNNVSQMDMRRLSY